MKLIEAFWDVVSRLIGSRPIILGCCQCGTNYYLTRNRIVDNLVDEDNEKHPVIMCPECGLEHAMIFMAIDDGVESIEYKLKRRE